MTPKSKPIDEYSLTHMLSLTEFRWETDKLWRGREQPFGTPQAKVYNRNEVSDVLRGKSWTRDGTKFREAQCQYSRIRQTVFGVIS